MRILDMLLKRNLIVGLAFIMIVLIGGYSLNKLSVELMPDITFDGAIVSVFAGEMAALDVEAQITEPLEQRVSNVAGVEEFSTTSSIGQTSMMVMFEEGQGDEAYLQIQASVQGLQAEIPAIEETYMMQFSLDSPFDYFLDVHGGDRNEMSDFTQNVLIPRLESLPEVGEVMTLGTSEQEIVIHLKDEVFRDWGMSPFQIVQTLNEQNVMSSLGEIEHEEELVTLRWDTRLTSLEDLRKLPVVTPEGIHDLADIADVELAEVHATEAAWKNGDPNYISVQISRGSGVTDIELSDAVRAEINNIKDEGLVGDFHVEELVSKGAFIQAAVDQVQRNVLIGGILALLMVLLFLRNIRATLIVGMTIPTSILLTFTAMMFLEYSVNMLTLIALGLGIGMMVDAAIVILEAIYRHIQEGRSKTDSVRTGVSEVAGAVIASMLTTISVFVPVGILSGELRDFMLTLALVIISTLLSSVLVSFTLIPVLANRWIRVKDRVQGKEPVLHRVYERLIGWMAPKKWRRWLVAVFFLLLLYGASLLTPFIPTSFMPDVYERQAELLITLERGTTPEQQRAIARDIDEAFQGVPDIKDYMVTIFDSEMMYTFINMTPQEEATLSQSEVNARIAAVFEELEETHPITSASMAGFGEVMPVQIEVKGTEFSTLVALAETVKEELAEIEGLTEIKHSMQTTVLEELLQIDREALKEAGLVPAQLREQIAVATTAQPIGQLYMGGEYVPIKLSSASKIETGEQLLEFPIMTATGTRSLSEFAYMEKVESPVEIARADGERVVTVTANYDGNDLGEVNRKVQDMLQNIEAPGGYTLTTTGELSDQMQAFTEMLYILLIALILVFVVMAIQFNSLIHPFVVMSIVPVTAIGVIIGLFVTQLEFNAMSAMGVVMLVGIVVNNAILFIDRTKQLRNEEQHRTDALIQAGKNRMRPIFMTTFTTAAGMLPLALAGGNASTYQAPMATVVISGLLFASLITLIFVPAVYMIMEDILGWPKRLIERRRERKALTQDL